MAEELKKKLFDVLHELPQKQKELEQLQEQYTVEHLSKQELLAEVESLKSEVSSLRTQLELTNKALHKCEENYNGARDNAVKIKLSLEASSHSSDVMKGQAVKFHNENRMLKKQIEQLEKEIKTEAFFRESATLKQSKIQATVESLNNQMRDLEKDFREVERKLNTATSIEKKSNRLLENKDHTINQLKNKAEDLSAQIVTLTSENKALKMNESVREPVQHPYVKEILKEWQNSLNEMKIRKKNYEKESETLHQSLQMSFEAQIKLQKFEEAAQEKVRELEAKLQEAKRKEEEKKSCTDCSIKKNVMAVEVGCQTNAVVAVNAATQSDYIELQMTKKEDSLMKIIMSSSTNQGDQENVPICTHSTSTFTPSLKYSSSSIGEMISKIRNEKAKQDSEEMALRLSQSKDISELPTQLNMNTHVKNNQAV